MKFGTLIRRSLRFHWRSHLGVVLGAVIGSAALIGALVVGDSVKGSLREQALGRLGSTSYALSSLDRLVRDGLAADLYSSLTNAGDYVAGGRFGGALEFPATASVPNGTGRANEVNVFGLTKEFGEIIGSGSLSPPGDDEVLVNVRLAAQLGVIPGDSILLRVKKTSALSMETPLAPTSKTIASLRLNVRRIVPDSEGGSFNLFPSAIPPLNAFVRLSTLQHISEATNKINLLVMGNTKVSHDRVVGAVESLFRKKRSDWFGVRTGISPGHSATGLVNVLLNAETNTLSGEVPDHSPRSTLLRWSWRFSDIELQTQIEPHARYVELRSSRIFLDPPVERAVYGEPTFLFLVRGGSPGPNFSQVGQAAHIMTNWGALFSSNAQPILTYLATLLRAGTNATPYSIVTAAGAPWTPADLRDDEIVLSQWLADDLQVKPRDEIALSYFLPESGAKLEEATNTFRVRSIVPMEMPWTDRTLMPDFPGIEKAESTSEWDAGFPLTYKVRPKDDEYWKQHRGTPKAFVTLAAGQKMWGNRFGNLTAIRFPIPTNVGSSGDGPAGSPPPAVGTNAVDGAHGVTRPTSAEEYRAALEKKILANLKPEELGLRFEPVREQALKAAEESQDFGGLFLGFSFFVIIAALLLMAMLFQLGLEQRVPEVGTLLALGFTPKQVRKLLLREGVALALLGGIIGTFGGLGYARAMIHGLTTIWRDAVGASALRFHFTAQTLVIGLFASVVVSGVTIWLSLRKFVKRPARELLVGEIGSEESKVHSRRPKAMAVGTILVAFGLVAYAVMAGDTSNTGIFFGAGALVLISGLSFASGGLVRSGGAPGTSAAITLGALAVRGCGRRRKRSLSTVAMLACGSFLIVSIGVFRLDANREATKKTSGTGGFALIGDTTMPVVQDLNTKSGQEFFALNERDLAGVSFVPFRVREGDEASCLNLNAAQKPRLLGVKPEKLSGRFAFVKSLGEMTKIGPWSGLERFHLSVPLDKDEIPAIGDANSIQWAMHKKVGDTIDYVDERGQPFKVRIVGAVANSILQGQLIIDEAEFVKRFPGESGYRTFLIDAPSNTVSQVSATLSRAMQDVGLELTPAAQRLDQFNAVQNTYLGTFQVLGGLGLLLGSFGLGIVVLRNVLERRGELALLIAVGFRKAQVQQLLLMENAALLVAGLVLGVIAAAVAVTPALLAPEAQLPMASLAVTLGAVLVNGAAWTWVATKLALRGDLLAALRNE